MTKLYSILAAVIMLSPIGSPVIQSAFGTPHDHLQIALKAPNSVARKRIQSETFTIVLTNDSAQPITCLAYTPDIELSAVDDNGRTVAIDNRARDDNYILPGPKNIVTLSHGEQFPMTISLLPFSKLPKPGIYHIRAILDSAAITRQRAEDFYRTYKASPKQLDGLRFYSGGKLETPFCTIRLT